MYNQQYPELRFQNYLLRNQNQNVKNLYKNRPNTYIPKSDLNHFNYSWLSLNTPIKTNYHYKKNTNSATNTCQRRISNDYNQPPIKSNVNSEQNFQRDNSLLTKKNNFHYQYSIRTNSMPQKRNLLNNDIMQYNQIENLIESKLEKKVKYRNFFQIGTAMIPHSRKIAKGGEDAYFVNQKLIAVADGVSAWQNIGIDAGIYSKKLCKNIGEIYKLDSFRYNQYPKQLLIDVAKITYEKGSSTCCILTIEENKPVINATYIGDSGYIILRKETNDLIPEIQIVYESKEQVHLFNMPYQIGTDGDNPRMALSFSHQIEPNDIIVMGTDGLFDNLSIQKIVDIVSNSFDRSTGQIASEQELAQKISRTAQQNSLNILFDSPFAQRARKKGIPIRGGKEDDITVVVASIKIQQ